MTDMQYLTCYFFRPHNFMIFSKVLYYMALFNFCLHSYSGNFLTDSPPNKLLSAKFLICFKFQNDSIWLKLCENIVRVSNSLDPGETPSSLASRPDPSCLHMALQSCLAVLVLRPMMIFANNLDPDCLDPSENKII